MGSMNWLAGWLESYRDDGEGARLHASANARVRVIDVMLPMVWQSFVFVVWSLSRARLLLYSRVPDSAGGRLWVQQLQRL